MSLPAGLAGAISIASGDSHSLALLEDGSVVAWGSNAFGQSTPPASVATGVIAIDARRDYSMALKADGSVVLWGRLAAAPATTAATTTLAGTTSGAVLYLSPSYNYGPSFADTSSYLGPWARSGSLGAVSISAGEGHALATLADGSVIAWGENTRQQCSIPPELAVASCIAAGGDRSAAIMPRSAPFITQQPLARRVFAGFSGTLFRIAATGVNPAGVQWQKDGADIPNTTGFSLDLTNITLEHAGTYRCVLTNAEGSTTSDAVRLDVGSPLLFSHWRSQHFSSTQINAGLAAPTSASDDSGVPNLLRYALGLSPGTADHHRLPRLDLMNDTNGTCHGGLTFEVPQDVADVIFRLRVSENLQNWTTYSVAPILGPVVNGRRKVTLCDPNPATSQPRFYKLEVMQTTPGAAPAY
jgi:hypothetical protein